MGDVPIVSLYYLTYYNLAIGTEVLRVGIATIGRVIMPQQMRKDIRLNSLVLLEVNEIVRAGLVVDDDVRNPIRLVRVGETITGVVAAELEIVDRETYEMAIYLEGSRRDGSGDMDAASQAANISR